MTEENRLVRVAVDAMGGDYAPEETVSGAVESARKGVAHVMLVGDPDKVQAELAKHETDGLPISTYPSEGVVVEGDSPATVLRQKRRASILVATNRVKKGEADAVVTMGSTGAAMASAAILLGVIKGIERPALGGPIIGLAPRTAIIDLGTNVDCKPTQLLGFAVIGHVFAQQFWGTKEPRVATLSVGAEAGKGNQLVKDASELISSSSLNFVGNIEANELVDGKVDVAVCDGFVGNVVMKLTEGLGRAMSEHPARPPARQAARCRYGAPDPGGVRSEQCRRDHRRGSYTGRERSKRRRPRSRQGRVSPARHRDGQGRCREALRRQSQHGAGASRGQARKQGSTPRGPVHPALPVVSAS